MKKNILCFALLLQSAALEVSTNPPTNNGHDNVLDDPRIQPFLLKYLQRCDQLETEMVNIASNSSPLQQEQNNLALNLRRQAYHALKCSNRFKVIQRGDKIAIENNLTNNNNQK